MCLILSGAVRVSRRPGPTRDGLTVSYLLALNQGIDLPDLAVILTASPEIITARLDQRGRHDRFEHDPAAASTETAMFRDASATLTGLGVPVIQIDTGILSPQQAASQIADALQCTALASRNMDDAWGTIEGIVRWLEAGEVAQAVIGTLGQNPRKGITHTWEDVQAELCDVIFTAMVALTTLTPDARETFDGHLARVASRSLGTPRAAVTA